MNLNSLRPHIAADLHACMHALNNMHEFYCSNQGNQVTIASPADWAENMLQVFIKVYLAAETSVFLYNKNPMVGILGYILQPLLK